jgi:hypothetical protein
MYVFNRVEICLACLVVGFFDTKKKRRRREVEERGREPGIMNGCRGGVLVLGFYGCVCVFYGRGISGIFSYQVLSFGLYLGFRSWLVDKDIYV